MSFITAYHRKNPFTQSRKDAKRTKGGFSLRFLARFAGNRLPHASLIPRRSSFSRTRSKALFNSWSSQSMEISPEYFPQRPQERNAKKNENESLCALAS